VFLVPGADGDTPRSAPTEVLGVDHGWRLSLPGVLETALAEGPVPWTELGTGPAGFAGTGTYAVDVDLPGTVAAAAAVDLVLLAVGDLARVRVNHVDCGVVWTAPWRIDVTAAVRPGRNTVVVEVANAWMNRLIAEAAAPTGEVFGPVAGVYAADAPMNAAGLTGPVVLEVFG
jgi:hypothetical protein